jgi:hypothetical protein
MINPDVTGLNLRVTSDVWLPHLKLYTYEQRGETTWFATNLTMTNVPEGHLIPALAALGKSAAQQLMDDLWRCGVRPTEGSGSAGSLAATERHLEDMRRIVHHKLGIKA